MANVSFVFLQKGEKVLLGTGTEIQVSVPVQSKWHPTSRQGEDIPWREIFLILLNLSVFVLCPDGCSTIYAFISFI